MGVQAHAEQPLLEGLDAVVLSGTGSGKTTAVLAPLVQKHLLAHHGSLQAAIVYVVPTKALGNDVVRRIGPPLEALGISVGLRHGDAPDKAKAHRAEVVVITPESLDVLVSAAPDSLQEVRAVVIDEAHLLYNTQRGLQLGILIRRLEARSRSPIQVVGLSATIASPRSLWRFFRPRVEDNGLAIIEGDGGRPIEAAVRIERVEGDLAALVDRVGQRDHCKVLVFVNSRRVADRLAEEMQETHSFKGGVFVHHSSIGGEHRERTEREFSARARALCVATSTLELGIDIGDVDLVILYGLVGGWQSFLQRIGRGNRRGDRAKVLCVSPHDDPRKWLTALAFLGTLRIARLGAGDPVGPMALHGAVVQQILSMLRERKGGYVRLAEVAEAVSAWPHLSRAAIDEITDALVEGDLCVRHGFQNRIGAGERMHQLEWLRLLWGNFPARSREVPLLASGREIGTVPASNLLRLSPGLRIRFAGRTWTIAEVHPSRIDVVAARGRASGIDIGYLGKGPGVDPTVLEAARQMLIDGSWQVDELAKSDADDLGAKWRIIGEILRDTELPFARENGGYRYLTFAGRLVNDVICRWEKVDGYEVDDLCIWSPRLIDLSSVPKDPDLLRAEAAESLTRAGELTIFQSMLPPRLLERDLVEPWCQTPYYARALQRLALCKAHEIESDRLRVVLA
jgi:ATP-dependent Lhr-like helicase